MSENQVDSEVWTHHDAFFWNLIKNKGIFFHAFPWEIGNDPHHQIYFWYHDCIVIVLIHWSKRHLAAVLLKANWLDPLMVQQWKLMINNNIINDVVFFSATNEETPYQQPLHYWSSKSDKKVEKTWINISQLKFLPTRLLLTCTAFIVE